MQTATIQARMTNPVEIIPEAYQAMLALGKAVAKSGVPTRIVNLLLLRASQINGCGLCVDMHAHDAKRDGETDERLFAVAAWRDAPFFTDAERAALALAEASTRLSDRAEPVSDEVWEEAARHYDEKGLSGLILATALINAWNRINVTTRQLAGSYRK